ncbi:alanine dehydrogenase [Paludibacter sp. 221]|uniref:alanine dehydrogenase n=1 Tax=Paludibacter sp. 221 TaxID=2302939 RepID=UPI0013CF91A8|nr:alanine dehydrogenase [Paludibacter sp. 221]NDV47141.1 alanine dehydrogenase [Paludibacter sp. 221]
MKIDPKTQQKLFPEECLLREIAKNPRLSIGIPKEDDDIENRLGLTPEGVAIVTEEGHSVYIQRGAGLPISYTDLQYSEAGAFLVDNASDVFSADIVLKVAPPTLSELKMMNDGSTILSLLQLNNLSKECIQLMIDKKMNAIAYELIKDEQKAFPVVNSLSEIEGISAIAVASELMTSEHGGKGLLLGSVAGVPPTEVLILGAGITCTVAAQTALAIGAEVKIFDHDINKLRKIKQQLGQHVFTSVIHPNVLFKALASADAVIANLRYINDSELLMISEDLVKTMKKGAIIIDLSVDQGGCFETSECRTIKNPVYEKHGVIHYCVPNISARVARTTSMTLSNIFAPMLLKIGNSGSVKSAISESSGFRHGVYVYGGIMVNHLIANYYGIKYNDIGLLIAAF